ncbi:hypothetical protein [Novosphingobium sp.]|uniref:hypothetical protein n=1 Tax=Novosphingobium sp. TaxID=1874826 RepID=UPI002FE148F2
MTIFLSYGLEPCQSDDLMQATSRIALPLAFLAAARLLIRACRKNSWQDFGIALAIVVAFIFLSALTYKLNESNQRLCAKRSWSEAAKYCEANMNYYRRSTDAYGYAVYTLQAPGTTDDAWDCLQRWKTHNGTVSLEIDESVHEAARAHHFAN